MELSKEQKLKFWERVEFDRRNPDACWIWKGWRNTAGYGQLKIDGKLQMAHKMAWMLSFGRMPLPGMFLLHECDNPSCVNPNHLKEGTHSENMRDMRYKGRGAKKLDIYTVAAIRQRGHEPFQSGRKK